VNLRGLPHPDALVGDWTGTRAVGDDDIAVDMELRGNGKVRYQESGAWGMDASGTWGYADHSLCIRLDRFDKGTRPWKGKIVGWELNQLSDKDMILKEGDGELRLSRRP